MDSFTIRYPSLGRKVVVADRMAEVAASGCGGSGKGLVADRGGKKRARGGEVAVVVASRGGRRGVRWRWRWWCGAKCSYTIACVENTSSNSGVTSAEITMG